MGSKTTTPGILDKQVGGTHYKVSGIQPIQYILSNKLPFIEGNIVKYITRWVTTQNVEDLEKIKHYTEILIDEQKV